MLQCSIAAEPLKLAGRSLVFFETHQEVRCAFAHAGIRHCSYVRFYKMADRECRISFFARGAQ